MARNSKHRTNLGNDLGLRNVLVVRLGALGEVAMTIPVLYSACQLYPKVRFIMLTRAYAAGIFINPPENLTVIALDGGDKSHGILQQLRLAQRLWIEYHPDALIDLQNDAATRYLRLYYIAKGLSVSRFNHATDHNRALTRRSAKVMLPAVSTRARYREAFYNVGMPLEATFQGLFGKGGRADASVISRLTGSPKPDGVKWIGIAPFAAYTQKEYPADKMEEVIRMLLERGDTHIFLFGAPGREASLAKAWEECFERVTSLADTRRGFSDELALMSHLDVMLTMDSANMHLAAIVNIPTVSIWGATHHYCGFKGWHQSEANMVQVPLSCRPCSATGNRPCYRHDLLCLSAIRPESVYTKVADLLDKK